MRLKIVGIGKCGTLIAYSLYAYTNNFKISTNEEQRVTVVSYVMEPFNAVNRLYRIERDPHYCTIDSDGVTNVELKRYVFLDDEGHAVRFPGIHYVLNNYQGGCNFHIVSESVVRKWENIPQNITKDDGIWIYVTSFSIAGGTGGGSAPVICRVSREGKTDQGRCHHMGLGILPKSDERYREHEIKPFMVELEKFKTGRFFASLYGDRFRNDMKSLWLFSNDVLRFLDMERSEKEILDDFCIQSPVNTFVAQSLTVLSNSSSGLTGADSNLDPRKLNDILAGRPFMSALSKRYVKNADRGMEHQTVKELLLGALRNVREQNGWLEGLSVPVRESGLRNLQKILEDTSGDRKQFFESLDKYDAAESPIEFQTTWRLVMLYGQPEKQYSEHKKDLLTGAFEKFFPNAQKFSFTFRHHGFIEILLLFFVDPFIRPVVASVYYYANNAWSRSGEDLTAKYDTLIGSDEFCEPEFLNKEEGFSHNMYGGGGDDVRERIKANPVLAIEREAMIGTFRHFHEIYHRKRPPMNTGSGLGRSPQK